MDLGAAPHRVRILDAGIAVAVAGDHRRALQEHPQVGGADRLAGLRSQPDQIGGEGAIGPEQCLGADRRGDVCELHECGEVIQGQDEHPEDSVGAVDQRKALLRPEHGRLDAGPRQRLGCSHRLPGRTHDLALSDHRQGAVRERGEVAAGPERTVLVDDRIEARLQHRQDRLGQHRADPGATQRQRAGAEEEHRADDLALDRRTHAGGVRANQRSLQLGPAIRRDPRVCERPESSGDPVGRLIGVGNPLDDRLRLGHRVPRLLREPDHSTAPGHIDHLPGADTVRAEFSHQDDLGRREGSPREGL